MQDDEVVVQEFNILDFSTLYLSLSSPLRLRASALKKAPTILHSSPRLLLRDAVEGAQAPDEVDRFDWPNLARWEQLRQRIERDGVGGIVEYRHDHHAVRDVEVQI